MALNLSFGQPKYMTPDVWVGNNGKCNYKTDGTADDVQIALAQAEVGNKGVVGLLPNLTYDITNDLIFDGAGSGGVAGGGDPASGIGFFGVGWSTILNVSASNKNCIVLKNGVVPRMGGFKIIMPSSNSGHGIFADKTGAVTDLSMFRGRLQDIYVNGCDATHSPFYLINPFWCQFDNLWGRTAYGDAFNLVNDAAVKYGNNQFNALNLYAPANKYMMVLNGVTNDVNLNTFIAPNMVGPSGGIKLLGSVTYNTILGMDLEPSQTAILFDMTNAGYQRGNCFQGILTTQAGQTGVDAGTTASAGHGGNKFDLTVLMAAITAGNYILKDSVAYQPRNEYDLRFIPGVASNIFSISNATAYSKPLITYHWAGGACPFIGSSTGTGSQQTIAHLLPWVPLEVVITPTVTGTTVSNVWADATNIYCTVTNGNAFNYKAS
jgi:hypothetical protein